MATDKGQEFLQTKTGHHQGQDKNRAVGQDGQEMEEPGSGFEWGQTGSVADQSLSYLVQHLLGHQCCHLNQGYPKQETEMPPGKCCDECFVYIWRQKVESSFDTCNILFFFFSSNAPRTLPGTLRGRWCSPKYKFIWPSRPFTRNDPLQLREALLSALALQLLCWTHNQPL